MLLLENIGKVNVTRRGTFKSVMAAVFLYEQKGAVLLQVSPPSRHILGGLGTPERVTGFLEFSEALLTFYAPAIKSMKCLF